ncbi:MAG: branched-chain amino acid ABC transporter permease [Dehalococcoidia bacterium]
MSSYVLSGITLGCIIALGAIGLTLAYGVLRFANFSHGDTLTAGAYIGLVVSRFFDNLFLGAVGAVIGASLIGLGLEKAVWRPLRKKGASPVGMLITAIGVAILLRHVVMAVAGARLQFYAIRAQTFYIGDLRITSVQIIIIATAVAAMLGFAYILQRTKLGKAMRATSDEPALAKVSGIDVNRVITWVWLIGTGLAGLAGFLFGLQTALRPDMGFHLLFGMFAAAILGGIGNPYGAMLGGLTIGLAQDLSLVFIPSQYKIAVGFVIMIIVLAVRPRGILGKAV